MRMRATKPGHHWWAWRAKQEREERMSRNPMDDSAHQIARYLKFASDPRGFVRRWRNIRIAAAVVVFLLGIGVGRCILADTVTVPVSDPRAQAAIEEWKQKALRYQAHLQAQKKRQEQADADTRTLHGVPAIGRIGHCGNAWWVNSQQSLRRVVEVCAALYRQYSPAAQALGAPGFRLRSCTTGLWYKQHKGSLNLWSVLYHGGNNWPWERDAWKTCTDGEWSRLRGW